MTNRLALRLTILASVCALASACSSTCDDTKCAPGNACVQDKCQYVCTHHSDCPGGYDCKPVEGDPRFVCVANGKPAGAGQYGTGCGGKGDAACDAASGFKCSGDESVPTAYCAGPCTTDAQCPGGYYCVGRDQADGTVTHLCMKRDFCAPAPNGVVDCDDKNAVLLSEKDANGNTVKYCSQGCTNVSGCGGNANYCIPNDDPAKPGICAPRIGSCAPTHKFCGRCNSREDCADGALCWKVEQGHEYFCTATCAAGNCAANPAGDNGVAPFCATLKDPPGLQPQCIPYDEAAGILSCWVGPCADANTCAVQ